MSWNRYARKADATTQQIVDELRAVGYTVEHIGRPVDIAVRHPTWPAAMFMLMECKASKRKDGTVSQRKDRQTQRDFCEQHGVPYVTSGIEALDALGARRTA